ncbi:hypothetical protein DPMN_027565 [Dreissena polymorpha]|uniref:Uncharacterized protein n=1 Tax=Dreissena polymorpha TaxID=45954 RepID=A0A9D4LV06_DREPO|nr:hypothetical protein DPMN_027565 [Dreissena polymorpha]
MSFPRLRDYIWYRPAPVMFQGRQSQDKFLSGRSSAEGVQQAALPFWPLSSPAVVFNPETVSPVR